MRRSLALVLLPVVRPHRGFRHFLDALEGGDLTSLPLFAALLGHFAAALAYALTLRVVPDRPPAAGGAVPPDAVGAVTAAVPFIVSLSALAAILLLAALLWVVGWALGARRPYGNWVGLAALTSLPGIARALVVTALMLAGVPGRDVLGSLPLDPFQAWMLVLVAFGFAAYAGRPLLLGAGVASVVGIVQAVLARV